MLRISVSEHSAPDVDLGSWRDLLVSGLADEDIDVASEGAPGAVEVGVRLRMDDAHGRTDLGAGFHVARGSAEVRVGRATVAVEGRPAVAPDAATRHAAARDDVVRRIVRCIAW